MSKPIEATLYDGHVELRRGANHVYRVRVDGGRSYPCPGVTTIIKMMDKSRPLMMWQEKVISFVVNRRAREMAAMLPGVGVSFRFTDHAKSQIDAGIRAMVDSVKTATSEVRDRAGDVGSQVHGYVEDYMVAKLAQQKGEKASAPGTTGLDREVKRAVGRFAKWFVDNEVQVLAIERCVFSREHFYTGQMDYLLNVAGTRGIWDAKTGNSVYPEVLMQRAAYRSAWEEEHPNDDPLGAGGILFFQREEIDPETKVLTGDFEVVYCPDTHKRDFEAFMACRTLYKFDKEGYNDLKQARA